MTLSVSATSSAGPITSVTVNAGAIGGSTAQSLVQSNGTSLFTNTLVAVTGSFPTNLSLVVTAQDNAGNSNTGNLALTVIGPTVVWNGGAMPDNTWSNVLNWAGGLAPAAGEQVTFAGTVNTSVDMETNYTINNLTFDVTAGSFTITNLADTLTLDAGSVVANNSANPEIVGVPIVLGGALTLVANTAAGNLVLSNTVSGSGALTSAGAGTNILSGANTAYTGAITISNNNTLVIGGGGQLGATGNIAGSNVGALGTGGIYAQNIVDNGLLIYNSTGNQQISAGTISGTGGLLVSSGTLTLGNGAANGETYTGPTVVGDGSGTPAVLYLDFNNPATGGLDTSSSLTINNGGHFIDFYSCSGAGYNSAVGTMPITINAGGTLDVSSLFTVSGSGFSGHLPGVLTLNGGTVSNNAAYMQKYGGWELQSKCVVNGGTNTSFISDPQFIPAQTGGTVFVINGGTNQTIPGVDLEVNGALTSANGTADTGIIVMGNGVMRLDGLNTYINSTTISNGATLILGTGGQLNTVTTSTDFGSANGRRQRAKRPARRHGLYRLLFRQHHQQRHLH